MVSEYLLLFVIIPYFLLQVIRQIEGKLPPRQEVFEENLPQNWQNCGSEAWRHSSKSCQAARETILI